MNVVSRSFLPISARPVARRTYGLLSTYPPTPCGLATFSAALALGLEANGADVGVVRVADGATSSDPRVMAEMQNGVPASVREATTALNGCGLTVADLQEAAVAACATDCPLVEFLFQDGGQPLYPVLIGAE